jgi:uncharacterized OsmC-like protein
MVEPAKIREIAERNAKMLALKPDRGHLTGITTARIVDGLRCEIKDENWTLTADMPIKAGGDETAPTPGTLGRGALASCLAIGISMWAARLEIPIDALEVEVQGDFDARGELGLDVAIAAGYQEVRYAVTIDSPANEKTLNDLIKTAEAHSPYLDVFSRPQNMKRILRHNGREV